jgi:[glutamine synthetase] adenylyltransferase / [glutamine synthetase]-adenylyl-L-tyrosine phosphorylase
MRFFYSKIHFMLKTELSSYAGRTLKTLELGGRANAQAELSALIRQPFSLAEVIACAVQTPSANTKTVNAVDQTRRHLRHCRQWLMLALFHADVAGQLPVERVCALMTQFAAYATQMALDAAALDISERLGIPLDENNRPQDLIVMAMGKAGADELNVSSDLDIVFIHRANPYPSGDTSKGHPSTEVLEAIAKQTVQILNDPSADGFVFRIDTRLRPFGESGPPITSLSMLESYLVTHGREWERFAWLKASVLATTHFADELLRQDDIQSLHSLLTPFVFRRYLDFQAIDSLRELHALIGQQAQRKRMGQDNAFDVKIGRGGIREIEFIAQLFQIIRGGKLSSLRTKSTVAALQLLAEHQVISSSNVGELIKAYWFWRRTEHMLQYRDDQQTHLLRDDDHETIAQMLGLTPTVFSGEVVRYRIEVAAIFDKLMGDERKSDMAPNTVHSLEHTGSVVNERLNQFRTSRRYLQSTPSTTKQLDLLLASVPSGGTDQEQQAAIRLLDFVEAISGRPNYLALMNRFPAVKERVLRLIGRARWAAQYLAVHPVVLDELLSDQWLESTDLVTWRDRLAKQLISTDTEAALDALREAHHAQVFRLLAQDIEGLLSTEILSDNLSLLADCVVELTLDIAWRHLQSSPSKRILKQVRPDFAVIAYGKLGGKELGYASDLDLVFVFNRTSTIGGISAEQDDLADETYAVLAQRLSSYLSLRTSAGILFEVDTRLRPNGSSGLIAISMNAFEKYQQSKAWIWEHQALTRARFAAGNIELGLQFESQRKLILGQPRDKMTLKQEIVSMREKMLQGHPNKTALFDIKHDRGAMVDIEFIVQYLVLAHSHAHTELLDNAGNIALLNRAAKAGLIPLNLAQATGNAYRAYRQLQHSLRLNDSSEGSNACRVEHSVCTVHVSAVMDLWSYTLGAASH